MRMMGHPGQTTLYRCRALTAARELVAPDNVGFLRFLVFFLQSACRIAQRSGHGCCWEFPQRPLTTRRREAGRFEETLSQTHGLLRRELRMARELGDDRLVADLRSV
jgi:hypothetical protein